MAYTVTIRLSSENLNDLINIRDNLTGCCKLCVKGQPVRPNSKFLIQKNMLIIEDFKCDDLDGNFENLLISKFDSLRVKDVSIKKELLISHVSETDQYGFELSKRLLKYLAENDFALHFSGVFV